MKNLITERLSILKIRLAKITILNKSIHSQWVNECSKISNHYTCDEYIKLERIVMLSKITKSEIKASESYLQIINK